MSNHVCVREGKRGVGGGERLIGSDRVCGTKRCRVRVLSYKIYERLQRGLVRVSRLNIWNSHVTHVNESCHVRQIVTYVSCYDSDATGVMSQNPWATAARVCPYEWDMSHEARHVTWVMPREWCHMSHVTKSMSDCSEALSGYRVSRLLIWNGHVTHMNATCHMRHVTSHESCHVSHVKKILCESYVSHIWVICQ